MTVFLASMNSHYLTQTQQAQQDLLEQAGMPFAETSCLDESLYILPDENTKVKMQELFQPICANFQNYVAEGRICS